LSDRNGEPIFFFRGINDMIIHKDICVGCGRCHPYCPAAAIHFEDLKSVVDQELCVECGCCLRSEVCPVDAIADRPDVYEYPRAVRKYFSDPVSIHPATGIGGRGTEESKTNDVTGRCADDQVGILIEVGRPTVGTKLLDIQKITRAIAKSGIHEIEPHNPIHSMIQDTSTGDLKPELLGERVLSAIIEIQVTREQLRGILQIVKEVAAELDCVLCLDVFTVVGPNLEIPRNILDAIESEGFSWRPNAKINMGMGRAWE
jgi:ferredoxin